MTNSTQTRKVQEMTNDREATCAERTAGHMADRAETFASLYRLADDSGTPDDFREHDIDPDLPGWDVEERAHMARHELPLSVEVVKTIKVLLSTGGPADGLTIELDRDGNVSTVRYWFSDWFDHAETTVDQDSPLWRYAEELAEYEWEMDR